MNLPLRCSSNPGSILKAQIKHSHRHYLWFCDNLHNFCCPSLPDLPDFPIVTFCLFFKLILFCCLGFFWVLIFKLATVTAEFPSLYLCRYQDLLLVPGFTRKSPTHSLSAFYFSQSVAWVYAIIACAKTFSAVFLESFNIAKKFHIIKQ